MTNEKDLRTLDSLGLTKQLIWNRRYKAWRQWFYAMVLVTLVCVFKDATNILSDFYLWSSVGLVGLIGGLSATDLFKIKHGA